MYAANVGAGLVPARWPLRATGRGNARRQRGSPMWAANVGAGPVPARWPVRASMPSILRQHKQPEQLLRKR